MYNVSTISKINLGVQGESLVNTVLVDCSEWVSEYPNGNIAVVAARPTEETLYIANTTLTDGILSWVVTEYDTHFSGVGSCQIQLVAGNGQIVKITPVIITCISKSQDGVVEEDPPIPTPSWVQEIIDSRAEQFEIVDGHLIVTKVDGTTEDLGRVAGMSEEEVRAIINTYISNDRTNSQEKVYSAKFVNDNFAPLSFVSNLWAHIPTQEMLNEIELRDDKPVASDFNIARSTSSAQVYNWNSPELTMARVLALPVTLTNGNSLSVSIPFKWMTGGEATGKVFLSFGARLSVIVGQQPEREISTNQSFSALEIQQETGYTATFTVKADLLNGIETFPAGTNLIVKVFRKQEYYAEDASEPSIEQIGIDYYFGADVDDAYIGAFAQFNFANVTINTDQIADKSVTLQKLSDQLQGIVENAASETFVTQAIATHNESGAAHSDIRQAVSTAEANAKQYAANLDKRIVAVFTTATANKTVTLKNLTGFTGADWGDGTSDALLTHTYAAAGTYTCYLYGVTVIGEEAFKNCAVLKSVFVPAGVTKIDTSAFFGCYGLSSVTFDANSKLTSIGGFSFYLDSAIEKIVIPKSVTRIIAYAFDSCTHLKNVVIEGGVKTIETSTFHNCTRLADIVIPATVTKIEANAFDACPALARVHFGGTKAEWDAVTISATGNSALTSADVQFDYISKNELCFVRAATPKIAVTPGAVYDIVYEWRDSGDYYGSSVSRTVLVDDSLDAGQILDFSDKAFSSTSAASGQGSGMGGDIIFIPTETDGGNAGDGKRYLLVCESTSIGINTPDTYGTLYYRKHPVL